MGDERWLAFVIDVVVVGVKKASSILFRPSTTPTMAALQGCLPKHKAIDLDIILL